MYSYSSKLLTFVEAKWVKAKFAAVGILIGIVILFGIMKPNQSVGFAFESRSANILVTENNFLRQQVSLISPRVSMLEMHVRQLDERANNLHLILPHRKIVGDTASSFSNAAKEFKFQSLILMAKSFRP
jgi:hypothetical protein